MRIQHIRNACLILQIQGQHILLDPCLNPKASMPPYSFFRNPIQLNPVVGLPPGAEDALERVTAALITHCRYGHQDHLDRSGMHLLVDRQIPVYCNAADAAFLQKRRITTIPLHMQERNPFLDGSITPVPATHGYGMLGRMMGPGAGYYLEIPGEKTLYIAGDTVFTPEVRRTLQERRPDICLLNAGTASFDIGRPILMPMDELVEFIALAPGKVIAVHMEAFNHCLTNRPGLHAAVGNAGLIHKLIIPADGELIDL